MKYAEGQTLFLSMLSAWYGGLVEGTVTVVAPIWVGQGDENMYEVEMEGRRYAVFEDELHVPEVAQ